MKALIVYYSRTGSNEALANVLKERPNCEIEGILDRVNSGGAWD
jgi:flavodoxin